MSQANLKSDSWCDYNISSDMFKWTFEPGQYNNTYVYGEVGINAAGGTAGSYIRPEGVDVDSFLSGRDEILSKCNPPVPNMDSIEQGPLVIQNNDVTLLIPRYTKEKKSAVDLGEVDYNRWQSNLPSEPQNLRFVIEDFAPQRGGMDTSNYSKMAWNPKVKYGALRNNESINTCTAVVSPTKACGDFCFGVDGYNNIKSTPQMNKPPNDPNYPFFGTTSQDIEAAGAAWCGPNNFYGLNYDQGSCTPPQLRNFL
jgi:hypothetical protein